MGCVYNCIVSRRSVRKYLPKTVEKDNIKILIQAASYAPSGNNIQPWKFIIIQDNIELKNKIASLTVFDKWVKTAPCFILVYYNTSDFSNKIFNCDLKHKQAIGASIQNILLAANELNLGTCWVGEILKKEKELNELLGIANGLELMALITVGYFDKNSSTGKRKDINEILIKWE